MSCRNQELHDAASEFAAVATAHLERTILQSSLVDLVSESGRRVRLSGVYNTPWQLAAMFMLGELERMPEFAKCVAIARNDPAIGPSIDNTVGTPLLQIGRQAEEFAMGPLLELLSKTPSFNAPEFSVAYAKKESEWYAQKAVIAMICPLAGFECPETVPLGDGLEISSFSRSQMPSNPFPGTFGEVRVAIQQEVELPFGVGIFPKEARNAALNLETESWESFERLVLALHLFKDGNFRPLGLASYAKNVNLGVRFRLLPGSPNLVFGRYKIDPPEAGQLVDFWRLLQQDRVKRRSDIQLAIRRFGFAKERDRVEDRMFDFVVAAEALLVPSAQGESKHRFQTNATLLGETNEQSRRLHDLFGCAYEIRNKLAHGGKPDQILKILKGKPFPVLVDEFEAELRKIIHRAIKSETAFVFPELFLSRLT